MEHFTFFWRSQSPFSQWHPSLFTLNGVQYNCAEQYMMVQKALIFKDADIAAKILKAHSPADQKKLGRQVKNFDSTIWAAVCKKFVYEANYAKFTQNSALKQSLLSTVGTTLVEASPVDTIWGIGLAEDHPDALDRKKWRGTNWLGEILTELREELLKTGEEQ
ncbi:NADAR family protein [Paenibacillus sp. N3.4]|uniref:NADAR family protein n=1 Tax=Paenibacillus sp. N3.4 TaxID=2603222 RepID=UPI0011C76F74|nr:NADAR family protein [Paenibacillus sp. N3.4]TXK76729.1 NADAR family protein [Paenibacillus sp. N3.4]